MLARAFSFIRQKIFSVCLQTSVNKRTLCWLLSSVITQTLIFIGRFLQLPAYWEGGSSSLV